MPRLLAPPDESPAPDVASVAAAPGGDGVVTSVARRFCTVVASHPVLDAYAGYVPPLLAVLQVRCELSAWQAASLLSLGSLTSGLSQPVFAWLTDRIDSRLLGAVGVAVAAAAISSIGLATGFTSLVVLFTLGMLGVGAFHPIAAASVGQLSGARRSAGVSLFFVAGMVGASAGPIISTRVTAIGPNGFDLLRWTMIPGLLAAVLLYFAIRDVPHRHHAHRAIVFTRGEARQRWGTAFLLLAGNAMRYSVYMAMLYLFVRWAEVAVGAIGGTDEAVAAAAIYCGELNAMGVVGMGVGGVLAGLIVPPGREKWPIVLFPILLAPAILAFPFSGRAASYGLALLAGIGYAAIIPISITVGQRLLPHRTSLASSLMMGGAWAVAAVGPPLAEWSLAHVGMTRTFAAVAGVLALSGLLGLLVPSSLLDAVARRERGP